MHALIDVDILCYEIGSAKKEDGETPLDWPLVVARVDARIDFIQQVTNYETWQGYLTGKGNFRDEVATILPYKGPRRSKPRPFWYPGIYNYLRDVRGCIVVDGIEADDALAIAHTTHYEDIAPAVWNCILEGMPESSCIGAFSTIVCSRDKDLKQVPGWHYTWPSWKQEEHKPHFITELDGLRFYYTQLLTGDSSDNILGLYRVGPKSAAVRRIEESTSELEMFNIVKDEYKARFGNYWGMFLEENGTLLWLLRSTDDSWADRMHNLISRGTAKDEPHSKV